MLSIGRAVGETAAVIFTMGSSLRLPTSLMDSGRTMAVHFYILAREGISMEKAYATALVLVVSILAINIIAYYTDEQSHVEVFVKTACSVEFNYFISLIG